ncbi:MAG: hypothetical protein AUK44_01845 [Porphyromonadaceae bacterium CG2_30_38_12]|nr:MAG: hypothetical protein AUK44_01845 [Porphyromonadaceae bacterium CG2_30_38_12]
MIIKPKLPKVVTKTRQKRRSNTIIINNVFSAVNELIEEVGFAKVTLTAIAERAQVEPSVFYRRFANLDQLFEEYTHKFDYWLAGIAELMPSDLSDEDSMKWIMLNLIRALHKNKGMQQLLIWELSDDNPITRRTAGLREKINADLIHILEQKFSLTSIDMNVLTAMMISGVYFLILHRDVSTFCNVDFSTKDGKERLEKTVEQLIEILFAAKHSNQFLSPSSVSESE